MRCSWNPCGYPVLSSEGYHGVCGPGGPHGFEQGSVVGKYWERQLFWGSKTHVQRRLILATVEAWKKVNYSSWKCNLQLPECPALPRHRRRSQERWTGGCQRSLDLKAADAALEPWGCSNEILLCSRSPFFVVTLITEQFSFHRKSFCLLLDRFKDKSPQVY